MVNKGSDDGVDRISALPEEILQHIMSFLPFKQIVQTSLVSKKWRQARLTLPILDFDKSVLYFDLWYADQNNKEKALDIRTRWKRVLDHLEKILQNRLREFISTKKFIISMEIPNDREHISFIDRCVSYVIEGNVKELNIHLLAWRGRWYHLPSIVFSANSIQNLELSGCKLELPTSNAKLRSLRKLSLNNVCADDHVIENLLDGCPLIEDLVLSGCRGFKILEILNQCKLNEIKLTYNSSRLQKLDIKAWNVHSIEIYDLSENCEINVTCCKNLKSLKLNHLSINDEWLLNQTSQLPNLEFLSITYCIELRSLRLSSPSLQSMVINRCRNLGKIKIETPNLSLFKYEVDTVRSLNDPKLLEVDICFYSRNINSLRYAKYIDLLAKFYDSSAVLKLQSESMIIPREMRQILPSPLPNVKHLNFKVNPKFIRSAIARVLDGFLRIHIV